MVYIFYIIFFFLILRFTVTLFNFISNPKLTRSPKNFNHLVSILIPARNEADNILILLESIKNQDYQNVEIIILDDQSDDETFLICEAFSKIDSRFKVVKGEELKKGWLGKNFACHQLAKQAKGKYLLFLDADEEIKDGLINNSLYRMQIGKLGLLSLFTNQVTISFGEKTIIPLMHYLLLNLLPLRLVKLSNNPAFSAASGQFMLFDAEVYHQFQWHELVKNQVVEDVEIMKQVKVQKLKGEALLANGFIYCRMYKGYREGLQGFSKNLLAGFGGSILGLFLYLFLVLAGPILILCYLNFQLFYFAITLIAFSRIMISFLSGQNVWLNLSLHILQMINLLVIAVLSIKKSLNKSLIWKGRTIHT
ncbi:MAG: glycosyltransferase family 2 protein [Bacteroidetes bacterium]|nr:glycosyltransferase family 2 protein [Bacteroidota bacterium]MBU1484384.1 glycosyltransferase family 2 protein [Bacteroidota bacterium]MBU2268610.1 glycosyltransferase family 2 protein [Bacteroidota bacterium]MBU2374500.1 glycosyltransferase family 2 protein [Bacteroidota bacterium]